jgi:hypothetical protein
MKYLLILLTGLILTSCNKDQAPSAPEIKSKVKYCSKTEMILSNHVSSSDGIVEVVIVNASDFLEAERSAVYSSTWQESFYDKKLTKLKSVSIDRFKEVFEEFTNNCDMFETNVKLSELYERIYIMEETRWNMKKQLINSKLKSIYRDIVQDECSDPNRPWNYFDFRCPHNKRP